MGDIIFQAWYMIAIFPFFIFLDGTEKLKKYAARHGYDISAWEVGLGLLVILFIILWMAGFRL